MEEDLISVWSDRYTVYRGAGTELAIADQIDIGAERKPLPRAIEGKAKTERWPGRHQNPGHLR